MNIGFALEYSLGHVTHADNLKHFIGKSESSPVRPVFVDLPFENTPVGMLAKLPGVRSNWSLRASCGAYLGLRKAARVLDAALFHTQVTSLLSASFMRQVPSVISLDATPLQYDRIGAHYGHTPSGSSVLENVKKRLNERAFQAAKRLVTWSSWAKSSLVADYGVASEKIAVIPPGIDLKRWRPQTKSSRNDKVVNLLFVGGDFERKGGDTLLAAVTKHVVSAASIKVHIVTKSPVAVPEGSNIHVYNGLQPNSDALCQLFASADAFVFPTRADCLPLAVLEAMAMGLPVITTDVGALSEAVGNGEAGLIVPPDDPASLGEAITLLADSPRLRQQFGIRARQIAEERFDSTKNYAQLISILTETARRRA